MTKTNRDKKKATVKSPVKTHQSQSFAGSGTSSNLTNDLSTYMAIDAGAELASLAVQGAAALVSSDSKDKSITSDVSGLGMIVPGEPVAKENWSGMSDATNTSDVPENWSGIPDAKEAVSAWSGVTQETKEMGAVGASVHVDAATSGADASILDSVIDGASEALSATGEMIGSVASGTVDMAGAVLSGTGDVIGSVASGAVDVAGAVLSGTGEVIGAIFGGLG